MPPRADLVARIERFAPPEMRDGRQRLWRDVGDSLGAIGCKHADDTVDAVLGAVVVAHFAEGARGKEGSRRRGEDWYWRERETLEEELARLQQHSLVRAFPIHAVEIFEPDQVNCPHGRRRKTCERIRRRLEDFALLRGLLALQCLQAIGLLGPRSATRPLFVKRAVELYGELRSDNVDGNLHAPDEFCRPLPRERPDRLPFLPPKLHGGRPVDELERYLIVTVIFPLTEHGLSVAKSCDYLQRIFESCFDKNVDAETLKRQWSRLPKNERRGVPCNKRRSVRRLGRRRSRT
jgi:hypothetical protein